MDPADLLGALARGALSSRSHKKSHNALRFLTGGGRGSFVNANTVLAAAGMAWGLFETWQQSQNTGLAGGSSGAGNQWAGGAQQTTTPPPPPRAPETAASAGAVVPPPIPTAARPVASAPVEASASADVPPAILRIVQLTIAAARADGTLGERERDAILGQARGVGAEAVVLRELDRTPPLADVVGAVTDPQERADLYTLAYAIVRADEQVSGSERIFLAQLATALGLDPATTARLEQEAALRIDAQGSAG
jgi:uncharacterized membrane protein YebE (DUF533 family)